MTCVVPIGPLFHSTGSETDGQRANGTEFW